MLLGNVGSCFLQNAVSFTQVIPCRQPESDSQCPSPTVHLFLSLQHCIPPYPLLVPFLVSQSGTEQSTGKQVHGYNSVAFETNMQELSRHFDCEFARAKGSPTEYAALELPPCPHQVKGAICDAFGDGAVSLDNTLSW